MKKRKRFKYMSDVKDIIDFEIPKLSPSIIMVTGVGGGGSNATQPHVRAGDRRRFVHGVQYRSAGAAQRPVPVKVRLGQNGLGAGNNPEKGRQAALESLDEIGFTSAKAPRWSSSRPVWAVEPEPARRR